VTPEIEVLRQKIDDIEDELISLLNRRATYALEIGKIKRKQDLPISDAKREEIILNRVAKKNQGPVSDEFMKDIFKRIIEETTAMEKSCVENGK
jgi:chorismate mutase